MGLFDNGREANMNSAIAMVEDVLIELGYFLNDCRDEPTPSGQRSWSVAKGSALVRIELKERGDDVHLRAVSVVMTLTPDVDEKRLFRHLLTLNNEHVQGAAFALDGDYVLLLSERATLDLDRSEVLDLIHRVRSYADDYDDQLIEAFGGVMGMAI